MHRPFRDSINLPLAVRQGGLNDSPRLLFVGVGVSGNDLHQCRLMNENKSIEQCPHLCTPFKFHATPFMPASRRALE